jgi:hypothetical protein
MRGAGVRGVVWGGAVWCSVVRCGAVWREEWGVERVVSRLVVRPAWVQERLGELECGCKCDAGRRRRQRR